MDRANATATLCDDGTAMPRSKSNGETPPAWMTPFVLAACTAAAILLGGYSYGADDQETDFGIIHRRLDATHLSHDWYVNTQGGAEGVRSHYAMLVATVARWTGLPFACAFWYVATLAALLAAAQHIGTTLFKSRQAGWWAAAVMVLLVAEKKAAWGYALWPTTLVSQCFSTALTAWMYALYLRGRLAASLALAVAGLWIHAQAGNHAFIIVVLLALIDFRRWGWRLVPALLIAAVALPMELSLLETTAGGAEPRLFLDYLRFRLGHHYDPAVWQVWQVTTLAAAWVYVVFAARGLHGEHRRCLQHVALLLALFSLMFVLAFQFGAGLPLIKAHFARHASIGILFAAAIIGGRLAQLPWSSGVISAAPSLGLATAFACGALSLHSGGVEFGIAAAMNTRGRRRFAWLGLALVAAVTIYMAMLSHPGALPRGDWFAWRVFVGTALFVSMACMCARHVVARWLGPCAAVGLSLAALPAAGTDWRSRDALHVLNCSLEAPRGPVERLALRSAKLLGPEAVVVLPPVTVRFTLLADRACMVSIKSNPHRVCYTEEWMRRIWECAHGEVAPLILPEMQSSQLNVAYSNVTLASLQYLHRAYGATHALVRSTSPAARAAPEATLAADEYWRLVHIDEPPISVAAH